MKKEGSSPLVSIIIPCYNACAVLADAVRSALRQSYSPVEIIVVDDGSTDDSYHLAGSFGGRVRIEGTQHLGACAARNKGVEISRGRLIQFLDADDVLHPRKLERQVRHALAYGSEWMSFTLATTNGASVYFDSQYGRLYDRSRDAIDFVLGGVLPTPAPLHYRKNLEAVGGFDESLPCAQEFDLHLRLVAHGVKLAQLREVLATIRAQPDSVSSDSLKVVRQKHYILSKTVEILREKGTLTEENKRSFGIAFARTATSLRLAGCFKDAARCRNDALKLYPDAETMGWTPRWRLVVRVLGSYKTARLRRWLKAGAGVSQ